MHYYIFGGAKYEENNQNKTDCGCFDQWCVFDRVYKLQVSKNDKKTDTTLTNATTNEEYDITEPQTVYGPPPALDDEKTTEEITTEKYNPEDDVPEDVYGPPEDFN